VRAGARGPVAGMMHSLFLLAFVLVAAPLASYIPLAALAAVLCTVAWNMAERQQFAALLRASRGDAVILLVTFLLVVFRDLTEGIVVGFCLGTLLFLHRMAKAVEVRTGKPVAALDVPARRHRAAALQRRAGHRSRRDRVPYFGSVLLRSRRHGRRGA
jgi:sulfate permease, SulP family